MKYINIFLPLIAIGVIIGSFSCQSSSTAIYEPPPQIPSETPQNTLETPKYDSGEEKSEKEEPEVVPQNEKIEEEDKADTSADEKEEETPKPAPPKKEEVIAPKQKPLSGNEIVGITGTFLPSSGFLISENGLVLTSTIVNKSTTAVTIVGSDFQAVGGEIIGFSEFSEIAVVQVTQPNTYEYLELSDDTIFPPGSKVRVVRSGCTSCPVGYQTQFETTVLSGSLENNISTLQLNTSLDPSFEGGAVLDSTNKVIGVITDPLGGTVSTIVGAGIDKMSLGSKIYKPTTPEDILEEGFSQATTPPFPSFFSGNASINGVAVKDGTLIYARIDNYISESVVTTEGKYSFLKIGPPIDVGFLDEKIVFYIDGFATEQTSVYETSMSDPLTKLDLSANVANYS
tara:strand:+ start:2012 stop:3208 length:1197 start_codon:yes stop_codon:yes gene_type:complete